MFFFFLKVDLRISLPLERLVENLNCSQFKVHLLNFQDHEITDNAQIKITDQTEFLIQKKRITIFVKIKIMDHDVQLDQIQEIKTLFDQILKISKDKITGSKIIISFFDNKKGTEKISALSNIMWLWVMD